MEQASSSDDEDNVNWAAGDAAGDSSDGEPVLDDEDEAEQAPPPPPMLQQSVFATRILAAHPGQPHVRVRPAGSTSSTPRSSTVTVDMEASRARALEEVRRGQLSLPVRRGLIQRQVTD